ncbi:MAG: hypothetical protein NWF05_03020 [Candidatus Bathyarchaeota archaeon]|nr:hypothetical protein [Candidatus Bathyarchaeota archaeon]
MNDNSTFEKIDFLNRTLTGINSSLSAKISRVEAHLLAAELDYMYGNVTEQAYEEITTLINQKIQHITDVLLELQKAEALLR